MCDIDDISDHFRIAEDDRLTVSALGDERARYDRTFPLWAVTLGVSFIIAGIGFTVAILRSFHVVL